jgi:N-acetylneuraminic acid mutarotase
MRSLRAVLVSSVLVASAVIAPAASQAAPAQPASTITPGHWVSGPDAPSETGAFLVWTGSEVLTSPEGCCGELNPWVVYAYDVTHKHWRSIKGPHSVPPRKPYATVWDGHELLYLGGQQAAPAGSASEVVDTRTGWALNPKTGHWRRLAPMPVDVGGAVNAVWTGGRVIIVGAGEPTLFYNPKTDKWSRGAKMPGAVRDGASVVWTGHQVLVWGGMTGNTAGSARDGWRYTPSTNHWSAIAPASSGAWDAVTVWTGSRMLVWGGTATHHGQTYVQSAGHSYNPVTNTWQDLSAAPDHGLVDVTGVWTGHQLLVWGRKVLPGTGTTRGPGRGAAYDPVTRTWHALATGTDDAGEGAHSVWTGHAMVVVGGWHKNQFFESSSPHVASWVPSS